MSISILGVELPFRQRLSKEASAWGMQVEPVGGVGVSAAIVGPHLDTPDRADRQWEMVRLLAGRGVGIVALVDQLTDVAKAMDCGARFSAIRPWCDASTIIRSLEIVEQGFLVVPDEIWKMVVSGLRSQLGTASHENLSSDQVILLSKLASGSTVAEIAAARGFSERTVYRHLRALYSCMGVANRAEAISAYFGCDPQLV